MDATGSDARPTGQPALTAYHPEGVTSVGHVPAVPQRSNPVAWSRTPGPHLDSHSRDNLRQASVALDTAYERITSLRNSINNMLNSIPPEVAGAGISPTSNTDTSDAQPRPPLSHDANIRPPHSALVLSGGEVVEELNVGAERLHALISPSTRQRLEEFETNSRSSPRRDFTWNRFSQNELPRLRPPPMPDLVLPRTRDLVDPRAAQRRDLQSTNRDESSTMIGRRVAARVNLNSSENQGSLSSRLSLQQIEQRLQAQTAQVARELENMTERLAATRSRRVELASARIRGGATATTPQENVALQAGSTASASVAMSVAANLPTAGRPLRSARDLTLADTARILLPPQISRTSSDGTPIDEPSAPSRRSLSAVFRDHNVTNTSRDSPRNLVNAPEVRGTLVNLLARESEEQSLSVRPPEHPRSGAETDRRDATSGRSNTTPSAGQGRRRRGWTRLNADGDEIDSDEDDNVSPNTRRLRMRFSYGTSSVDQPALRSHTVTIEDILWRTSGSDSEVDALSPDATDGCQSLFQGSPPRTPLPRPHPLPTPAEDMLTYPTIKPVQRPRMIRVSKYASLAGR